MKKVPVVGQKVRIKYGSFPHWNGVYPVIKVYDNDSMIIIDHPVHGEGGFFSSEYELIPLTKLEKALK